MILINFNNYKLSNKSYGGSERKLGIIIDDNFYINENVREYNKTIS